jgi:dephospho-CoA kinase
MIAFGLTGGIACGKSTVTKTFRKHGIPIVDADIIARQVVDVGTYGYFALLKAFGRDYFNPDGTLARGALG